MRVGETDGEILCELRVAAEMSRVNAALAGFRRPPAIRVAAVAADTASGPPEQQQRRR
jgi:hypothetical protein